LNLYAYCGNNPVNRSDHDGSDWRTALAIGVAVTMVGLFIAATIATGGATLAFAGIGASAAAASASAVAGATIATGVGLIGGSLLSAAITTGGKHPTQVGRDGEQQAGIDQSKKTPIQVNGRTRIPDALDPNTLTEVKNVRYISNTIQLRDFATYATSTSRTLRLVVRAGAGTKVAKTVVKAGWQIIRLIK
jgi:hypothetical protein